MGPSSTPRARRGRRARRWSSARRRRTAASDSRDGPAPLPSARPSPRRGDGGGGTAAPTGKRRPRGGGRQRRRGSGRRGRPPALALVGTRAKVADGPTADADHRPGCPTTPSPPAPRRECRGRKLRRLETGEVGGRRWGGEGKRRRREDWIRRRGRKYGRVEWRSGGSHQDGHFTFARH